MSHILITNSRKFFLILESLWTLENIATSYRKRKREKDKMSKNRLRKAKSLNKTHLQVKAILQWDTARCTRDQTQDLMHENKLYYQSEQGTKERKKGPLTATLHSTIQPPIDQEQGTRSKSLSFWPKLQRIPLLWVVIGIPDTHHKLDSKTQSLAPSEMVSAVHRWNP